MNIEKMIENVRRGRMKTSPVAQAPNSALATSKTDSETWSVSEPPFPSPLPSPSGRGNHFGYSIGPSETTDSIQRWNSFSLSPRERAGVRGKRAQLLNARSHLHHAPIQS